MFVKCFRTRFLYLYMIEWISRQEIFLFRNSFDLKFYSIFCSSHQWCSKSNDAENLIRNNILHISFVLWFEMNLDSVKFAWKAFYDWMRKKSIYLLSVTYTTHRPSERREKHTHRIYTFQSSSLYTRCR